LPEKATELFIPFLERVGYAVRVEESTEVYADAAEMAGTDLVVQCVTMSQITTGQLAGLCAAVEAGTGFTGWHGGIADSFRASSDYLHPRPGASVTAGIEDFELVTEQYWVLHDDLVDVLATTTHPARPWHPWHPWHRPVTCPAIWTRQWGAGRVVVTTPGHSLDVLEHPSVRTVIERGMSWATRTASAS
jgi:type 1 glutamine amidotransferase